MNERYFLGEGRFTKRDEIVRTALREALSLTERKTDLGKISLFLFTNFSLNNPRRMEDFRRRKVSEIILSKKCNGCSDYGIIFAALAREANVPTRYVETIEEENLLSLPEKVSGHIFVDLFLDGEWVIYEPKEGFKTDYILGARKYIPVARGLDFSELYLENGKKIKLDAINKIRNLRDRLYTKI